MSASKSSPSAREVVDVDESEIEETINRIKSHKGVLGVIILTKDGVVLRSTVDEETSHAYASLVQDIVGRTRLGVRDLDPANDLSFVRIRTKKHEIMIAPDKEYMLVVVQNPNFKEGSQNETLRVRALNVDDDSDRT
ncbi:dynein light chain roadblock-type 2-like [Paramacrobiotus metropolitanus]|uniref:dynein light chain roadblock-type 2-like n=1 Tax=Paramacrobiotus metropolitanus TaxID=2943436 RepID=UPI002445DFD0|nr:dynein light chain roadblock-type 2-like [Paramacrobiotus metropolitanus]